MKLEQTGSTIFQTLAGVALDIKTKKKEAAESLVAPVNNGDARDIQYLLNAFLLLNVVQFGALVFLARLDRKQKKAAARRMAALLPPIVEEEEDASSTTSMSPDKGEDTWNRFDPSTQLAGGKSATGTIRSLRGLASTSAAATSEQSIPLLRSPSISSITPRSSRYLSFPNSSQTRVVRTKSELKRGEFFAVLSGASIAFAWVLFMVVAWLRLRSKEERTSTLGLTH